MIKNYINKEGKIISDKEFEKLLKKKLKNGQKIMSGLKIGFT